MQLTLESRSCGNVYVVECAGRLVAGEEVALLETTLNARAGEFSRLVLDLGGITRMDSTGIGLLVRFATRLRQDKGDLRLAAPPDFLVKLLEMTKLTSVLPAYATQDEAILSFLKQKSAAKEPKKQGPRVLFLDQSADLCAFVRTVLTHNGFDVQSTSFFRDARILIQVNSVDYILVGPGSSAVSADSVVDTLKAIAPKAKTLRLDNDFGARDAHEAAAVLLQMIQTAPPR
jgi:anti-anti-sigma factor